MGVAAAALLLAGPLAAQTVTTDRPAGYIVFPKIVSDPSGAFSNGVASDTVVQITNTSENRVLAHCFYVDGTTRCNNGASVIDPDGACRTSADCTNGGLCTLSSCAGIDFDVPLTPNQPVGWTVSAGVQLGGVCVGGPLSGQPCDPSASNNCNCQALDLRVPPLAPGIFFGELKCVEIDPDATGSDIGNPINANDLIGTASIYNVSAAPAAVDVRSYNAIGIQAVSSDRTVQTDSTMQLGGAGAEYAGCPAQLILNHFFDGAVVDGATVGTDVTFVPCSETPDGDTVAAPTQLQFLVYNEFEQRFSAGSSVSCFREVRLSNIDRRLGQELTSVFNVAVQGTLAGQTVVRPVLTPGSPTQGNGVLAILEEFHTSDTQKSAAYNVNVRGSKSQPDYVIFDQ